MRISDWSSDVCSSDLDRLSIRAEGQRSATGLALAVDLDVETCPYLEWDWRVERLQEGANPYERALDDGAASILVMFGAPGDFAAPRPVPPLRYLWTVAARPQDTILASPSPPRVLPPLLVPRGVTHPLPWVGRHPRP